MPIYRPIEMNLPDAVSPYDLVAFGWLPNGITADFIVKSDAGRVLRVTFDGTCIVRLLDEMPLSTEDDGGIGEGLVADHFAYLVEGALFAEAQSEAWKAAHAPAAHYRFLTGWTCMDVLSPVPPMFSLIEAMDRA